NYEGLLFESPVKSPKRAQAEHRSLQRVLERNGTRVLRFRDLLDDVLADSAVRQEVITETLRLEARATQIPSPGQQALRAYLESLPPKALRHVLIAGLTQTEMRGGKVTRNQPDLFLIHPLPNTMFVRDIGIVLGERIILGRFAKPARQRETLHARV